MEFSSAKVNILLELLEFDRGKQNLKNILFDIIGSTIQLHEFSNKIYNILYYIM